MLISAYYVCVKNTHPVETVTVMRYNMEKHKWEYKDFHTNNDRSLNFLDKLLRNKTVISLNDTDIILQKYNLGYKFLDLEQKFKKVLNLPPNEKISCVEMAKRFDIDDYENICDESYVIMYQEIYEELQDFENEQYRNMVKNS